MRFSRIITGVVTAGLVGLVPVAVSSPAAATENLTATVVLETYNTSLPLEYGGYDIRLSVGVTGSNGASVYDGTITVYAMTASNPAGSPIQTVDATGFTTLDLIPATQNMTFKAVYSGWTATNQYEDNVTPAESAPLAIPVTYKLKAKTPGTSIVGKIKPSYAKKKVVIQRKVGKSWKKYRSVRTNAKSAFRVKLPTGARGKKVFFRVIIKGTPEITGLAAGFYTIRY